MKTENNKYCPHYSVLWQKWMQVDDLVEKVKAFKELWEHCNTCKICQMNEKTEMFPQVER